MFKRIDEDTEQEITGFSYKNKTGILEFVSLRHAWVDLKNESNDDISAIFYQDIPNLIKALKAAYTQKTGLPL